MLKSFFYNFPVAKRIFWFGIFFLPSAPSFSILFLLSSAIISIKDNFTELLKDKLNLVLISAGLLMPIISLKQNQDIVPLAENWNKSLTWIGLTNWLPLIFCFLSFQNYLKSNFDRRIVSKLLIAGSLPVILSGIAQYIFKIYGTFEFLNGFVVWFLKPIQHDTGLTGLFSNQNYAGAWFCIVWPFCLASFLKSRNNKFDKFITLSFLISVSIGLLLTTSRSAWGGLILLIPLMTGISTQLILTLIVLIIIVVALVLINISPDIYQSLNLDSITKRFLQEFNSENFIGRESRIEIWREAIGFIIKKPIWGWGAATFPVLYLYSKNAYAGHPHNLILELSISYGIPITLLIFSAIFYICYFSFQKIFIDKSFKNIDFFERAWFSSFFVLLCTQLVDIQYFDGRISLVFWILLAGLKCTI